MVIRDATCDGTFPLITVSEITVKPNKSILRGLFVSSQNRIKNDETLLQ